MSEEDKQSVAEGAKQESAAPAPKQESVEYSKYIGVKEMLTKAETREAALKAELETFKNQASTATAKVTEYETKVQDLETQITTIRSSAGDPAELKRLQDQLMAVEEKLLSTKRAEVATQFSIDPTLIKDMGETQLELFVKGLEAAKGQKMSGGGTTPRTDMGEGGRATAGDTAKSKIAAGFEALHPKGI